MIIDIHTHLFSPSMCAHRDRYFSGESAFELLYASPRSKMVEAEDLLRIMDAQGVDKSVIFGFPWRSADHFRENNDYIIEAAKRFPDRLIGFCCLDPFNSDAVKETQRCFRNGLRGVGELAFYEGGIDASCLNRLDPIMGLCRECDFPVLIHTNEPVGHMYPGKTANTLSQIYAMVRRYPENRLILAHWGGGIFFYGLLKKEFREAFRNVYFDTAASPFLYSPEVYPTAARIIGIDKILLGTDYPLLNPERYFREIDDAQLEKKQVEAVCGKNAMKVLGL